MREIKADLHNHFTTKSRVLDVNRVVDTVRENLGVGGICALVNYDDQRYEAFARKAESVGVNKGNSVYFPDRDVLVVKGEEIPTREGDLLVLGLDEGMHLYHGERISIESNIFKANELCAVNVLPHPFFHSKIGKKVLADFEGEQHKKYLEYIHAVEIWNSNSPGSANDRAEDLHTFLANPHLLNLYGAVYENKPTSKNSHIGKLSSTDGHAFRSVGRSYTKLQMPNYSELNDSYKVNEALRTAVCSPRIGEELYKERTLIDSSTHVAIISGIFVLDKVLGRFGKSAPRGDKEARR